MKFVIDIPESEFKADIDDVISREPFTNRTICEGFPCDECSFNRKDKGGCILEERVMNLPSAKPQEPKTGHWDKGYTFPDGEYWKCTKCNELIKVKYPMKYCNNCGAKMESEVEE